MHYLEAILIYNVVNIVIRGCFCIAIVLFCTSAVLFSSCFISSLSSICGLGYVFGSVCTVCHVGDIC